MAARKIKGGRSGYGSGRSGYGYSVVLLRRSRQRGKKMTALIEHVGRRSSRPGSRNPPVRMVHFGAVGYSDYTLHRDRARMERYLIRHRRREDWSLRGIFSPGFWSRWVLWNKPTLRASIQDIRRRFGIRVRLQ